MPGADVLLDVNHVHLLVEVTPWPPKPLSDEQLLQRVRAISSPMAVAILHKELKEAREKLTAGLVQEEFIEKIHARYTYRMHDLSEFMKGVMQRFTQWFNGKHKRSGTLWEQRFKSVIDYAPLHPCCLPFPPPEMVG